MDKIQILKSSKPNYYSSMFKKTFQKVNRIFTNNLFMALIMTHTTINLLLLFTVINLPLILTVHVLQLIHRTQKFTTLFFCQSVNSLQVLGCTPRFVTFNANQTHNTFQHTYHIPGRTAHVSFRKRNIFGLCAFSRTSLLLQELKILWYSFSTFSFGTFLLVLFLRHFSFLSLALFLRYFSFGSQALFFRYFYRSLMFSTMPHLSVTLAKTCRTLPVPFSPLPFFSPLSTSVLGPSAPPSLLDHISARVFKIVLKQRQCVLVTEFTTCISVQGLASVCQMCNTKPYFHFCSAIFYMLYYPL